MYRAATLAALRRGILCTDQAAVTALAQSTSIDVRPASIQDGRHCDVLLEGEDVTWAVRSPEVDAHVSEVSAYPGVRKALGRLQREIGDRGRVVMVGRDIGTVILPGAELKLYLNASGEERARRRHQEGLARGEKGDLATTHQAMIERDRIDSTRDLAPLRPAADAIILDTTILSEAEVFAMALQLTEGAPARRPEPIPPGLVLPARVRFFRAVGRPIFRLLFHILCRVQIEGRENIPAEGGYLVSSNHLSIIDPPFIVAFWPRPLEAAGAVDILDRPGQGQLMRWYGGMAVHRGAFDRAILDAAAHRLEAGLPVLMDPEGRRSRVAGMQEARPGVAYLAARTGVPVVPVGITGAEDATARWRRLRRGDLRMIIGRPVRLPPVDLRSPARRAGLRANTETLMRAIAALLPEAYRGVYA
jgi:cytidylate kinase